MTLLLLALACKAPDTAATDSSTSGDSDSGAEVDEVARAPLQFRFPVIEADLFYSIPVTGVDHDPEVHGDRSAICTSYAGTGFPWCYDEHEGSDFLLDGGFDTMDAGSATIVAAADGVVEVTEDGNYDRCHADGGVINCDGYPMAANYVVLVHETGDRTLYWHMMSGSVAVTVGQEVKAGDVLGIVGSSGNSSMPHLHFGLEDEDGLVIDPFAGPSSQEETWWCEQNPQGELPGLCEE